MRADRLLSIMLLLQTRRRMTGRELARRLEVSERTIHRDMQALGIAGVPVVAERGSGGGWMLLDGYHTNLTGLNEAEIQALFASRSNRLLDDLGLQKAEEAALIKLLAALPAMSRQDAEYARQRLYVDSSGWSRPDEAIPHLPTLQDAIWRGRRLRFTYERGAGGVEREGDPLGLVVKGSVWYLVATIEGSPRTYRVSRIQRAEVLEEPAARPPDFDLVAYWEQSAKEFRANLPRYPVRVRVEPDLVGYLRYAGRYMRVEHIEQPDPDGWVPVTLIFEVDHAACEFVLGFGARIEVIEPAELRERVLQQAREVVMFYCERAGATLETAGSDG
ncbi:MAG TPA: YafY family protein [Ktedonobacterales bacterium]